MTFLEGLNKYGAAGGSIVALAGLLALARPVAQSSDPPWAGTKDIQSLSDQFAMSLSTVNKALATTQQKLDHTNRRMDATDLYLNTLRRKAVLRDIDELTSQLAHHPADARARDDLAQDKQDLDDINAERRVLLTGKP